MQQALDALTERLTAAPLVPLIQSDDPDEALHVMRALARGGIRVVEVVLRTERAYDVARALAAAEDDITVGVGTVLSEQHARDAVATGAEFLVSPGFDPAVVRTSHELNTPILPGVATASEAQCAWNLGLRKLKFFPATQSGGVGMLKALSSVFRDVQFMPTGGISPANVADFVALDAVLACGGSWLTPSAAIAAGDWDAITKLAADGLALCAPN
ncbi:MAG: bifunctional 4-hydroxy-2-oxoglutarate aldolase/2-dehydro-3-deoxy-phosphogluconate aldolase [Gammaproteobacteria bacterium]